MDHLVLRERHKKRKKQQQPNFVCAPKTAADGSPSRGSVLCRVLLAVAILLLAGACFQYFGQALDSQRYPPRGVRLNIHGQASGDAPHFMHLECVGRGGPTVLFEAGLPFSSLSFALVLEQASAEGLTANLTLCAYDRSGYAICHAASAWSDIGSYPRNISVMADELNLLVKTAKLPEPLVLVGWSYGSIIVELYALRHPGSVAGLVLIDGVIANQTSRMAGFLDQLNEGILSFDIARFVQWVGLFRLAGYLGQLPQEAGAPSSSLPHPLYDEALASVTKYKFPETAYQELLAFTESEAILNEALRKGKAAGNQTPLGALPIVSLVAIPDSMPVEERKHWIKTQQDEADHLSTHHHLIIADSDHYVPWSNPHSVIDGIKEIISMVAKRASTI